MNGLTQTMLIALHAVFLGNAAYSFLYNFPAEDVDKAPIYFRLAQTANIIFSVCAAQIARQLGPLRKPTDDFEGQAVVGFVTGFLYSILTAIGALSADDWGTELRNTDSFRYMRSSVIVPLQAVLATVFLHELTNVAEAIVWMACALPRLVSSPTVNSRE